MDRHSVPATSTAFPSLPFLTDAYIQGPQSSAAAQQHFLLLQPSSTPEPVCGPGVERLSAAGVEGWVPDTTAPSAMHLLGASRDGEAGDFISGVQDPTSFAASYFGSYLCSPSTDNAQTPTAANAHSSLSPIQLVTSPETGGGSSTVGGAPLGGHPLCSGMPFPFSQPSPVTGGLAQEGPPSDANQTYTVPQQEATHDTQGFASDYDRLTRELGKDCATLRDLVTDNLSSSDELNSTLDKAIRSADQVASVQRKLLLSVNQQRHLIADSKIIHSKLLMLHRIFQKVDPQYSQWLEEHDILKDHIQRVEQQHRDFVGSEDLGVDKADVPLAASSRTVSCRRNNSSSNSSNNSKRRKSTRQYKRQQLAQPPGSSVGIPLTAVKTERTPSCS